MKKLYRSRINKILAGVCGGIGEYFDIDPTIIRLLWILFIFAGGSGIIAYIIAWLIVPQQPRIKKKKKK
jgi:phage shock protein PspC (stress-responsive transcriptional regulator)